MKQYYQTNRDRVLEKAKQYYYQHRDARLSYARARNKRATTPSRAK